MKWRHWAILIVLVLLNYIIFSTAFTQLAAQRRPQPRPTRTPQPTFESVEARLVGWIVVPTSTRRPTRTPVTAAPTAPLTVTASITATAESATAGAPPPATETPPPPTATPTGAFIVHTVKQGETLSVIAQQYGVTIEAITQANGITDPSLIVAGQELTIPLPAGVPPTATPRPQPTPTPKLAPTKRPTPKPTKKPPPTATPTKASSQFSAELTWDPLVAPNCSGPAIAKQSTIKDEAGNPINGVRVEVNCYGNVWLSHPSGTPGEYDAGHYDFSFGQSSPQNWTCTARVFDIDGQLVASSDIARIQFDTNDCKPHGPGHQVVILNWIKHW